MNAALAVLAAPSSGVDIQTFGTIVSILLGVGAVAVGVAKAVSGLRRFSRLLDGFLGDGKHASVPDRLTALEDRLTAVEASVSASATKIDEHVDGDAKQWLADGQAWGNRLDGQVAELDTRVAALEQAQGSDPVVASRK